MKTLAGLALFAAPLAALPADAREPARLVPPPARAAPALDRLGPPAPRADQYADRVRIGAQVPIAGDFNLGVGLFSVGGHFVRDGRSRGREPLIDTGGRQNKVAAVGFNLRF